MTAVIRNDTHMTDQRMGVDAVTGSYTENDADKYPSPRVEFQYWNSHLNELKFIFHTKSMLIVKLDYGFRLNLYMDFDIFVVDFDI